MQAVTSDQETLSFPMVNKIPADKRRSEHFPQPGTAVREDVH